MPLHRDTNATSSPFAFAVAGVILLAIIGTLLLATQTGPRDATGLEEQVRRGDAESLLDLFMESQGVGWESGADGLTSLGIRADNGSGLDLARLQAFHGALYDASANGKVDYNESLALLGLSPDDPRRYHLRIAPVGLQTVLSEDLSGIRTAYIGDFTNVDTSFNVPLGTPEAMIQAGRDGVNAKIELVATTERDALTQLGLGYDDKIHLLDMSLTAGTPQIGRAHV